MITISGAKIAVADDHAIVRKGITDLLSDMGAEITIQACNGRDLIDKLCMSQQIPDICVLDINMPVLDGYETIKVLYKEWKQVKTLVMGTCYNEHHLVKMLNNGARGFILKEAELSEICEAVAEIHQYGVYYSRWEIKSASFTKKKSINFKKYLLSDNELTFLKHCCSEMTYKEIAGKMNTTLRTIDGYRNDLFEKLDIKSRVGLVLYAVSAGMTTML